MTIDKIQALIKQGYESISRKHHLLAAFPTGMSGLEALATVDEALVERLLENANRIARCQYLRVHATHIELTVEEHALFFELGGKSAG